MPSKHKYTTRTFRPKDLAAYERAKEALQQLGITMDEYLNMCIEYAAGKRDSFPLRPPFTEPAAGATED